MLVLNRLAVDTAFQKAEDGEFVEGAFDFTPEDLKAMHDFAGEDRGALDPFFFGLDHEADGDARYHYPAGKWSGGEFRVFHGAVQAASKASDSEEIAASATEILSRYQAKVDDMKARGQAQADTAADGGGVSIAPGGSDASGGNAKLVDQVRDFYATGERGARRVLYRSAKLDRSAIDKQNRTAQLVFASTHPVERWWGVEVLSHDPRYADFSRLRNEAAWLREHTPGQDIGVVEKAWLDGQKSRAINRYSTGDLGEKEMQMNLEGVHAKVSVGYEVTDVVEQRTDENGNDVFVVAWSALEISNVSVPQDDTAGLGRSRQDGASQQEAAKGAATVEPEEEGKRTMGKEINDAPTAESVDVNKVKEEARKAELARVQELRSISEKFGEKFPKVAELARQFIDNGQSVADFREAAFKEMATAGAIKTEPPRQEPGSSIRQKDLKGYCLYSALKRQKMDPMGWSGLERELSDEIAKDSHRDARGVYVPASYIAKHWTRSTVTTGALGGGNLVGTDHLGSSFIELLRNRSALMALGAQELTGLTGDVDIPSQIAGAGVYWIDNEASDVTENTATLFGTKTGSPKTIGAKVPITRKMRMQSDPVVDQIVMNSLQRDLPTGIDYAGIYGNPSGSGSDPVGILNTSGIGDVPGGTNGAAPAWDDVVNLEREVAIDNADVGSLAYLTNPKVKAKLKTTETASGNGIFVWPQTGNELNGYRAMVSNQVPSTLVKNSSGSVCSAIIFGNFADLWLLMWGGLDLRLDNITNGDKDGLIIRAFQDVDFIVRHAQSFAAMQDALTT